jgi:translation initiation factor 5
LQVSKKYVSKAVAQEIHEKAAPFIKWLAEAEEEESSEEDDEVEVSAQLICLFNCYFIHILLFF